MGIEELEDAATRIASQTGNRGTFDRTKEYPAAWHLDDGGTFRRGSVRGVGPSLAWRL
jgi:hypothetical protein